MLKYRLKRFSEDQQVQKVLFRLALFGLVALSRGLAQDDCASQTIFDVDSHIACPVVLPPGARAALAHDPFIRGVMHDESKRDLPEHWFSATYVRLGAPGEKDLLVIGNKGPLPGANVDPVWVLYRQ